MEICIIHLLINNYYLSYSYYIYNMVKNNGLYEKTVLVDKLVRNEKEARMLQAHMGTCEKQLKEQFGDTWKNVKWQDMGNKTKNVAQNYQRASNQLASLLPHDTENDDEYYDRNFPRGDSRQNRPRESGNDSRAYRAPRGDQNSPNGKDNRRQGDRDQRNEQGVRIQRQDGQRGPSQRTGDNRSKTDNKQKPRPYNLERFQSSNFKSGDARKDKVDPTVEKEESSGTSIDKKNEPEMKYPEPRKRGGDRKMNRVQDVTV